MLPRDRSLTQRCDSLNCFRAVRSSFARAARFRYPSRSAESYSTIRRIPVGMGGIGEYWGVAFAARSSSAAPRRLIQAASSKFVSVTCVLVGSMQCHCCSVRGL